MDEFDKFAAKEGELLESIYGRLTTLVDIIDRNNVRPISVSINTKFIICLQPEWSKYVTMVRHNQIRETVSYDMLYDSLVQFEPRVIASKSKKAAMNHDPLALIAHSNSSSSQSHANSSYSLKPYYVTHPSSVVDYEDEHQGDLHVDAQEDKLRTAMMLLARVITQKFSTPTNNRLPNGNAEIVPSYDAKAVSEVNASSKVHEQMRHEKCKTIIQTSDDDQIDSSIIFDNPYVENNAKEGELLESIYGRLTTLVDIIDRNNVHPISVSINTNFIICLQPEWSKYVTMVCHNQIGETVSYDMLYDSLVQFKPRVIASKSKKAAMNHDPLALIAHSNSFSSQSHANSSYSLKPYYVTHPSSVVDYEDKHQGDLHVDAQEDKLRTAMMLLARDGRVDIQTKNAGYGGNGNKYAGRQSRNQVFNAGNRNDDNNQIIQHVPRTESTPEKENV
nr:hypothetical protein [Tanacetum cinerariifolium]